MERILIAPSYNEKWLEIERPQPLIDNQIELLISQVIKGGIFPDITDQVYIDFKKEMINWLSRSNFNQIKGFEKFNRVDIINGCTQFIDAIYMKGPVQILKGDYKYHSRLTPNIIYSLLGNLHKGLPLIIAMPFPSTGDVHNQMLEILDESLEKNIDVHIDGAWVTCCQNINFDLSHKSIKSIGISLSKGLGLGWNRIGLRWSNCNSEDSISIMNDFRMNNRALANIGLYFLRNLPPDYLWNTHASKYYKICNDFNLVPTNSIYLALRDNQPVGLSPLIRYLENATIL